MEFTDTTFTKTINGETHTYTRAQVHLHNKIHDAHPTRTVRNGAGERVAQPRCGQQSRRFFPGYILVGHETTCEKCLNARPAPEPVEPTPAPAPAQPPAKTQAHRTAAMRLRGLEKIAAALKTQRGLISDHDYRSLSADLFVKLDDARRAVEHHEALAEAAAQVEAPPAPARHPAPTAVRTVRNGKATIVVALPDGTTQKLGGARAERAAAVLVSKRSRLTRSGPVDHEVMCRADLALARVEADRLSTRTSMRHRGEVIPTTPIPTVAVEVVEG